MKLPVVEIKPNKIAVSILAEMMTNDLFLSNELAIVFILLTKPDSMMASNFLALELVDTELFWPCQKDILICHIVKRYVALQDKA